MADTRSAPANLPVLRCLITLALVSLICSLINRAERAHGAPHGRGDWVRTADGWESRTVLEPPAPVTPQIHPALVAAFQGCASVFVLIAFPGQAVAVQAAPRTAGHLAPSRRGPRLATSAD